MVCHDERYALVFEKPTTQASNRGICIKQILCSNLTERDDQLGFYELNLASEIRLAVLCFIRGGIAIVRGATLHDIRNVSVMASFQIYRRKHVIEQFPSLPDEGFAMLIFIGA